MECCSSRAILILAITAVVWMNCAIAMEHIVGNSTGWTNNGFNYTQWALSTSFFVGDTLLFSYVPEDHNVLRVDRPSFQACNLANPLEIYTDGNTVIQLSKGESYYFLCGVGLHCLEGQKVKVDVNSPGPSPTGSLTVQHSGSHILLPILSAIYVASSLLVLLFIL